MSYRKITVDNVEYKYTIGAVYVKIHGRKAILKEDIGEVIEEEYDKILITPSHIAYYIKHGKKQKEKLCKVCNFNLGKTRLLENYDNLDIETYFSCLCNDCYNSYLETN